MTAARDQRPVPLGGRLPAPRPPTGAVTSWLAAESAGPARALFAPVTMPGREEQEIDPQRDARLAEAFAEARREGLAAGLAEEAPLRERLAGSLIALEVARRAGVDLAAEQIADLAVMIAREILSHAVAPRREALVALVRGAVATLAGEGDLAVRLNPSDVEAVRRSPPPHQNGSIRLIDDPSIAVGDCIVESRHRVVDGTLAGRLEEVRAGIAELLETESPC